MIILIDNYDSFTYNLYQILAKYEEVKIFRNNKVSLKEIADLKPEGIVISPGPGRPADAGIIIPLIKEFKGKYPILGVCLGHQAIAESFGGKIVNSKEVVHGKRTAVILKESKIFKSLNKIEEVMRYHSLIVEKETFPNSLEIIAETKDKEIMGLKHKKYKLYGIQFHPESIYTNCGKKIIDNFISEVCK